MFVERAIPSIKAALPRLRVLLAVAVMCIPLVASAQLESLNSTREGKGTLNFLTRSSSNTVRRVQVVLHKDKRGDVNLLSGASEKFSGRWKAIGNNRVLLDIDRVGNDPAVGSGQILHNSRGDFISVSCSGSVGRRKFEFSFSADAWDGGNGGGDGNRGLRITRPRDGSNVDDSKVTIEGTSRARDVTVKIYDDGKRLVANHSVRVRNDRWSTDVKLDRGRYQVVVRDSESRRSDEASFSVRRGDNDNGDVDDRVLKDNARDAIRDRFRGYDLDFSDVKVGSEALGNRTVKGEFKARGRGDKKGDYRMKVVCRASSGRVVSVDYDRK